MATTKQTTVKKAAPKKPSSAVQQAALNGEFQGSIHRLTQRVDSLERQFVVLAVAVTTAIFGLVGYSLL
jgi:hypothetical protein